MSQNFIESLHLNEQVYSGGNLLIANQDGNIEGGFVLHHLVADFIKRFGDTSRVIIILTKDTIGHWTAISSKLGWNLTSQVGLNRVAVLDLPRQVYLNLTCSNGDGQEQSNSVKDEDQVLNDDGSFNLENILNYCKKTIIKMKQNYSTTSSSSSPAQDKTDSNKKKLKFLLILDDLPTLYYGIMNSTNNSEEDNSHNHFQLDKQVMIFIQNLLNLNNHSSNEEEEEDICVGALVNSSLNHVSNHLVRVHSGTLFDVSPLHTGYSQLFSGYLTVTNRRQSLNSIGDGFMKSFQFKLDERNIQFSPLTKTNF